MAYVSLVALLVESVILSHRHRLKDVSSCLRSGMGLLRPIVAEDMYNCMSDQKLNEGVILSFNTVGKFYGYLEGL